MADDTEPSLIQMARADGTRNPVAPINLGARVRELRKARDWTLEQAAQKAGLARSTLSKIENGQMSPTFELMKKLAEGLSIELPQLFTQANSPRATGRMDITRNEAGQPHATPTYEHELLNGALTGKTMLPYRTRVRARSLEEFEGWVRHDGEEFLYVLTGSVRLFTEFYEPVDMARGDSAYYDASMGHNVVSTSVEDALILWVTSMV